jgi:uncharacterized protein YkwD
MKVKSGFFSVVLIVFLSSCASLQEMFDRIGNSLSNIGSSGGVSSSSTPINADPNKRAAPDSTNWDIENLDTAKDVDYLSGIEKDAVLEMNMVRSDPKKYGALYIQPKLQYFNGNNYSVPGQITLVTQEGKKAVDGCITALSKLKAVGILTPEKGLSLGAKDHAADQGKTGDTGHDGSDKSTPFIRINRYGSGYKTAGENLAYGGTTGRDIVTQLLIDDGVPSRGHRTNIMNKNFSQTGVSFGTHPQYRTMCAITYASGYTSNE